MNKDTFLNNLQKQEKNYKISKMVEEINKEFPLQDEVKSALFYQ